MALPLVPPGRIAGTLAAVQRDAPIIPNVPQAVQDMHGYVNDTFTGANPLFDPAVWNVFNTVDRTTNVCEGFHSSLIKAIGKIHPSIFKIVEFWINHEDENERVLAQIGMGAPPKQRKKKYVIVDESIARLVDGTFGGGFIPTIPQILHYVDAVAYQLWDKK
jgi:hypothetical protein